MIWSTALAALVLGQAAAPTATLSFKDGVFTVTDARGPERVSIRPTVLANLKSVSEVDGPNRVVWDARGITVTQGRKSRSTKLPDLITSPKLFDRDQITETVRRLTAKEITREAAGISGWCRIGSNVYFLVRWETTKKVPWLEAVVRVDLKGTSLVPEPITAMSGLTGSKTSIDRRLVVLGDNPAAVTKSGNAWGLETVQVIAQATGFTPLGSGELDVRFTDGMTRMLFVEKTPYKSHLAGTFDLITGVVSRVSESSDPMTFPGDYAQVVRIERADAVVVRSLSNGLELSLPKNVGVRSTRAGVLVWTPLAAPRAAIIYDYETLRAGTRWNAPSAPPR